MVDLSSSLLLLFGAVSLVVILWSLLKEKEWQQVTISNLLPSSKPFVVLSIPLIAASLIASSGGLVPMETVLYLLGGLLGPFVLSRIGLTPHLRSIVLLALGVLLTSRLPADNFGIPVVASISGLLLYKVVDNLSGEGESSLEDILPVFVWLTGTYWLETAGLSGKADNRDGLILGVLTAGIFLRWVQSFILYDDRNWFKRLLLSLTGGGATLIIINKLLLATEIDKIAALAGAGFFMTYIFQAMEGGEGGMETVARTAKRLILIGIFTLLATRLFGMLGLLVIAAPIIVATKPGVAHIASMFFASRVLLQSFIFQFNPNVTGVNITHAYTTAALFAGFFLVVMLSLLLKNIRERWVMTLIFAAAAIALPPAANFFLHAEPTASLLVSSLVAAVMFVIFSPALYGADLPKHETIILLPAGMTAFAALSNALIPLGNEATSDAKLYVLIVAAVIFAVAWAAKRYITSRPQPQQPAEAP